MHALRPFFCQHNCLASQARVNLMKYRSELRHLANFAFDDHRQQPAPRNDRGDRVCCKLRWTFAGGGGTWGKPLEPQLR